LTAIDHVLTNGKDLTGENIRQAIFDVHSFNGLIPMTFDSNTATVKIAINKIENGKDAPLP
jgi:hypothetical protein